ncbi:MAG TPA: hypothetical protein VMA83_09495 [Solirubrobacteraceae bacterium]|nr:hypothetical protein [Solirubrobacteraceae bacterium]
MTLALRMFAADFLKQRKKVGTAVWSLVLVLAPLLIFFIVRQVLHSSSEPHHAGLVGPTHPPAGGVAGYRDAVRLLALFFGPLAAILIGTDGGAGDVAAGVFRDLVVTGRSRVGLFFSRVPAALAMCWIVMLAGYLLTLVGTYALADGSATPGAGLVVEGLFFTLLSTGVVCVVAVGFAALTGSRPAALTVLIGWQLIASRILESIEELGSSRRLILSQAIYHFSPIPLGEGRGPTVVTMSTATAILVIIGWLVVFAALGAWRTATVDA